MLFPLHPCAGLIEMDRIICAGQMGLDLLRSGCQSVGECDSGSQHGSFGYWILVQIGNQFGGVGKRNNLVHMEVHHLRPNAWDILGRLGHSARELGFVECTKDGTGLDFGSMLGTFQCCYRQINTRRFSQSCAGTFSEKARHRWQWVTGCTLTVVGLARLYRCCLVCPVCPLLFLPRLYRRLLGFFLSLSLEGG